MGTNNPNFPDTVLSETEAIQYLGSIINAMRTQAYAGVTGSPTLTAAQMVGGAVAVSGGTTATATTDTAANIIARMKAIDANAGTNSTSSFHLINDNSGTLTFAAGTGVTLVGGNATTVPAAGSKRYQIKITGASAVSLTAL